MVVQEIDKVIYVGKTHELYIKFVDNVIYGYDTVAFVDVPVEVVKEFKDSEDRVKYFNDYIRTKYPYYETLIEFAEVQTPTYYNKCADPMTYEEYCAKLQEEMRQKDINAINALG